MSNPTTTVVPFRFQSREVRALIIDDEPWFVAKDVCDVLEYADASDATQFLDDDEKLVRQIAGAGQKLIHEIHGLGQRRNMLLISESGLYTLIIRSNKPQAKAFRRWVTHEVLPTIRKTGGYQAGGIGIPLIPETLKLKPSMRQRLWNDAMQAARLDGQGTTEAAAWFAELCRMMTARPALTADSRYDLDRLFDAFAADHLVDAPGRAILFRDLYRRFVSWHRAAMPAADVIPSAKSFSRWLDNKGYARRKPSGNTTVYGCALVEEVTR
jgi:prophage antirepressor-like protein